MGEFSAEWLQLREPADRMARSARAVQAIAAAFAPAGAVTVLDLATGSGANPRYLIESLPGEQDWLLVDHMATLLAQVPGRMASWGAGRGYQAVQHREGLVLRRGHRECRLTTRRADLRTLDDDGLFEGRTLVTASALLDLVSEDWLRALARRCRRASAVVLFALTYDGRIVCSPSLPEDAAVCELVNRHQRTDKGFGAAAGPEAAGLAETCLARLGYHVERESSDWLLSPTERELQRQLIDGWAEAALSLAPDRSELVGRWRADRLSHVEAGRSRLVVGHQDVWGTVA